MVRGKPRKRDLKESREEKKLGLEEVTNSKPISSRAGKGDATSACFVASQKTASALTVGKDLVCGRSFAVRKVMWRLD